MPGIEGPVGQKGDVGFPGRRGENGDFGLQGEIGLDGRPGKRMLKRIFKIHLNNMFLTRSHFFSFQKGMKGLTGDRGFKGLRGPALR